MFQDRTFSVDWYSSACRHLTQSAGTHSEPFFAFTAKRRQVFVTKHIRNTRHVELRARNILPSMLLAHGVEDLGVTQPLMGKNTLQLSWMYSDTVSD